MHEDVSSSGSKCYDVSAFDMKAIELLGAVGRAMGYFANKCGAADSAKGPLHKGRSPGCMSGGYVHAALSTGSAMFPANFSGVRQASTNLTHVCTNYFVFLKVLPFGNL